MKMKAVAVFVAFAAVFEILTAAVEPVVVVVAVVVAAVAAAVAAELGSAQRCCCSRT